jgi:hypothetical protein
MFRQVLREGSALPFCQILRESNAHPRSVRSCARATLERVI